MKAFYWIAASLALAACDAPQQPTESVSAEVVSEPTVEDMEAALADSAAGWNEGDMDRFIAIYSDDPATTFVGSNGLVRGKAAMEERYRERYDWSDPDPAQRGVLSFETLDFRPLGSDYAQYVARYTLTYPDGREPASGLTSLLFARENGTWRLIADHSS